MTESDGLNLERLRALHYNHDHECRAYNDEGKE